MNYSLWLAATESAEQVGGVAALGVDVKKLAFQLLTFVLIFLLLKKFAFKSILEALEDRRQKIDEGLKLAEDMGKRETELNEQVERTMSKARSEAESVIAKSHEEAGAIVAEATAKANKRAEEIAAEQQGRFELEVAKARTELKKEVLGLVVDATETVLEEKLDDARDRKLVERALRGNS